MSDRVKRLADGILEISNDEVGVRLVDAINRVESENRATILTTCAQILATDLAGLDADLRDDYFAAFRLLVMLYLDAISGTPLPPERATAS